MQKILQLPDNINDIPVVFIRTPSGIVSEKISINELKKRTEATPHEDYRIKLYRNALEHYANQSYEFAELLLVHLIQSSESMHYEYYENLASVYRAQHHVEAQIEILELAIKKLENLKGQEALLRRVNNRLTKALQQQGTHKNIDIIIEK